MKPVTDMEAGAPGEIDTSYKLNYILFVQNNKNQQNTIRTAPSPDLRRYMEDMSAVLVGFGLAVGSARVYAYLLVKSEPVSLDEMSDFLGMSKSGVSVAARTLETINMARRISQTGSRRILYVAHDDFDAMIESRFRSIEVFLERLERAKNVAERGAAGHRIDELIDMYEFILAQSQSVLADWKERKKVTW